MSKIKLIIISVVILALSLLLVFKNELKYFYYKDRTLNILKSNYSDAKTKKIVIDKSNYIRNFYMPYSEVSFKINNESYYGYVDLREKEMYDNYYYKRIYSDLSKKITSIFGKKPSKFELEYGGKTFDAYSLTNHHITRGKYNGDNLDEIIEDGRMSLEFNTIDIPNEIIERFINRYKNIFDTSIRCIEDEKKNIDYKNPKSISKSCFIDNKSRVSCREIYRRDIDNVSLIGTKDTVQRVSIEKTEPFSISNSSGLYNYDYKIASEYYKIKSSNPRELVVIRLNGKFDFNKEYRFVIRRNQKGIFVTDGKKHLKDEILEVGAISLGDFIELVLIEVTYKK